MGRGDDRQRAAQLRRDNRRGGEARGRRRALQRARGQHGEPMAFGDEFEDRGYRVDLHRHLRAQAEAREAGLDQAANRVGLAGEDQRKTRQVGKAQPAREARIGSGADQAQRFLEQHANFECGGRDRTHTPADSIEQVSPAKVSEVIAMVEEIVKGLAGKSLDWSRPKG